MKTKAKATARGKPVKSTAARAKPAKVRAGKASAAPIGKFTGFDDDAFAFLAELERHNERPWFEARRDRYERSCRAPALAFIAAMAPELAKVTAHLVSDPRPVGGSLMRIHRDVRFSGDKSPYKTNIGIQFRHSAGKDVHAPGLYLHVDPQQCFLGVGMWRPEPEALAKIRQRIVERPSEWAAVRGASAFRNTFSLGGDSLARPPRGFDPQHPYIDDLRRKDHIASCTLERSELAQADLPKRVGKRLAAARDYLRFLCNAIEVPC